MGFDFGTSTTIIGGAINSTERVNIYVGADGRPFPSLVTVSGSEILTGFRAEQTSRQKSFQSDSLHIGSLLNPKSLLFLGNDSAALGGFEPHDLVAAVIREAKQVIGGDDEGLIDWSDVVATVPISMDGSARRKLRRAFEDAGIGIRYFIQEPLAALVAHLRTQTEMVLRRGGEFVLVVDWGAGTLDATICRVGFGRIEQILAAGTSPEEGVGGSAIDQKLAELVAVANRRPHQLGASKIALLWRILRYLRTFLRGNNPFTREFIFDNDLITQVEGSKILFSRNPNLEVDEIRVRSNDGSRVRTFSVTRDDVAHSYEDAIASGRHLLLDLIEQASREGAKISKIIAVGGVSQSPEVRSMLEALLPGCVEWPTEDGSTIGLGAPQRLIAEGAALIAAGVAHVSIATDVFIDRGSQTSGHIAVRARTPLPAQSSCVETSRNYMQIAKDDLLTKRHFAAFRRSGFVLNAETTTWVIAVASFEVPPSLGSSIEVRTTLDSNGIFTFRIDGSNQTVSESGFRCEVFDLPVLINYGHSHPDRPSKHFHFEDSFQRSTWS